MPLRVAEGKGLAVECAYAPNSNSQYTASLESLGVHVSSVFCRLGQDLRPYSLGNPVGSLLDVWGW